ncbi:MAG: oligosaccharide flippase family protein, partial [Pseudomonadota bacterium]|nr:oligosaccharide flippase family protein [Pseudomonadota bacterium]
MSQPQALKSTAIRGVGWLTGAKILRSVSALVTLSIMSRFLPPEAFGLAGLIILMTGLAQTFGDFGTRLAIIRK